MNAAFFGLCFGVGVCVVYLGWRPRAEPLDVALARLEQQQTTPTETSSPSWDIRFGGWALRHADRLARLVERVRCDLRIVERRPEEQAARTLIYAAFGLLLGPWLGFVAWFVGTPPPVPFLGAVSLVGGTTGAAAPWTTVRTDAARRRRDCLLAVAAWCDLVAMSLAAGRGIEQSVTTAALAGEGWAFGELRGALSGGHVRGEPPWASLERLGSELGVGDLRELASTIAMAGEDGAAIRDAVSTKAHTIRERITFDTERAAEVATAHMGMPTFAVAIGFLIFLGWPALVALSRSGF